MIVKHLMAISGVVALMSQGCNKNRDADSADDLYSDESNEETSAWTGDAAIDDSDVSAVETTSGAEGSGDGTGGSYIQEMGDGAGGADDMSKEGTPSPAEGSGGRMMGTGGISAEGTPSPAEGSGGRVMGTGGRMMGTGGRVMGTGGRILGGQ